MKKILTGCILCLLLCMSIPAVPCQAEIAGEEAFADLTWEQVYEEDLQKGGVVQSVCATEDYIITLENTSDETQEADTVSAYYRGNQDEEGNEVEPFTLAKRVSDMDWEHCNGMTYNPLTHEIYVALYINSTEESRGSIYVMDPDTLGFKRAIKISDDYNILGIGYKEETDQYIIQTDVEGGYSFKVLDADFQLVEDLGEYADTIEGSNFQDLEVCGDYILNFPLTLGLGIGDFLNVYSISEKRMVTAPAVNFNFEDISADEPESICELEPGVFLAAVNIVYTDGTAKIRYYKTVMPYYFDVTLKTENGTAKADTEKVLRGESVTLSYKPDKKYELSGLTINKKDANAKKESTTFTIENVQEDQSVQVIFTKIPFNFGVLFGCIALLAAAVTGFGIYYYILLIRRERRRKYMRAKRRRERMRMEADMR